MSTLECRFIINGILEGFFEDATLREKDDKDGVFGTAQRAFTAIVRRQCRICGRRGATWVKILLKKSFMRDEDRFISTLGMEGSTA